MTNLERLKIELNNKHYFSDEVYSQFLDENGLDQFDIYEKANDQINLLETVYSILRALANDLDTFREVETEFVSTTAAYQHLQKRLNDLRDEIDRVKHETNYQDESGNGSSIISYMFYNSH